MVTVSQFEYGLVTQCVTVNVQSFLLCRRASYLHCHTLSLPFPPTTPTWSQVTTPKSAKRPITYRQTQHLLMGRVE